MFVGNLTFNGSIIELENSTVDLSWNYSEAKDSLVDFYTLEYSKVGPILKQVCTQSVYADIRIVLHNFPYCQSQR